MRASHMGGRLGPLALVLCVSMASACSSKKDDATSSSPKVAASQNAKRGGNARLPSNEPRYLNPVLETRANRANMLIFEGLVAFDAQLNPVPRLAEKWDLSEDGKTLTFHLRRGVTWSDGEPFTSKDVAFTIDKIRTTNERTLWRTYFSRIAELKTPDNLTVEVTYERPYAPAVVSFSVGMLPAHRFAKTEDFVGAPFNSEPVGTGPFQLARWERGGRMLLKSNPNWWYGDTGLDTVELLFGIPDNLEALKAGKVDFASIPNISDWATEAQLPDFLDKFEQTTTIESIFRVIAWNTERAPFNNAKVRTAITHALNRERVVEEVMLGQGQMLSAPFFANMFGADPKIAPHTFDLDKAEALLSEAGIARNGDKRFEIDLITLNSQKLAINTEMFAIFTRDLSKLGIDLKVSFLDASEFETRRKAGDYDAFFFGWLRDIPDPDPSALLHSLEAKGGQNFAMYSNPEVDGWLEQAVSTTDKEMRKELYGKIHRQIFADMPYTVLYAPNSHYAWSRHLRRVRPEDVSAQTRFPGISRWSVAPIDEASAAQ